MGTGLAAGKGAAGPLPQYYGSALHHVLRRGVFPAGQPAGAGPGKGKNTAGAGFHAPPRCVEDPVGAQKPEAAGADDGLLPTSGRKGMEAGALGERFEKLIDKSHKKRYILFINALKKSVHRLGPHREPGAAENPAGYRRGTVTLEQKR